MIPQELNITIDKALHMNPELKKAYEEQDEIHYLIDMARRLEGLPRHTSMHAAGVVISQKDDQNMCRFPEHQTVRFTLSLL